MVEPNLPKYLLTVRRVRVHCSQVFLEKCYGRPADVFSFALVAWEITHGEKPFRTIIWSLRNLCF